MDTCTHTPVRPTWAERARTVLAAAASASVCWDGGRVDLLGCHHDDAQGDVILTLDATSALFRAVGAAPGGELTVRVELTELCAVSTNQRVLARVCLSGSLREDDVRHLPGTLGPGSGRPATGAVQLLVRVSGVAVAEEAGPMAPTAGPVTVPPDDYRCAEPDPLHGGAAEHLQHLSAHHAEVVGVLSRLCDREALTGALRVLPITLDRYGIVLRVERLRDHRDVRLAFATRTDSGDQAAVELHRLLALGSRRRPCGR